MLNRGRLSRALIDRVDDDGVFTPLIDPADIAVDILCAARASIDETSIGVRVHGAGELPRPLWTRLAQCVLAESRRGLECVALHVKKLHLVLPLERRVEPRLSR